MTVKSFNIQLSIISIISIGIRHCLFGGLYLQEIDLFALLPCLSEEGHMSRQLSDQ